MITNDEAFDAMAERQRRQLLFDLLNFDPQPVAKLSNASQEVLEAHETLLQEYLSGSREIENANKAAIRTHHVHLPKLVQYSYIDWDHDASLVSKGVKFDDVRPLVEVVGKQRDETRTIELKPPLKK